MSVGGPSAWRPPHAYVPGRTPRHPEDLFDRFKQDIDQLPRHRIAETRAWDMGRAFLKDGYFWEAHEMFEAIWMVCAPNSAEKLLVQAIIQRANAGLKREMGLANAAQRLTAEADRLAGEAFQRSDGVILAFRAEDWSEGCVP